MIKLTQCAEILSMRRKINIVAGINPAERSF